MWGVPREGGGGGEGERKRKGKGKGGGGRGKKKKGGGGWGGRGGGGKSPSRRSPWPPPQSPEMQNRRKAEAMQPLQCEPLSIAGAVLYSFEEVGGGVGRKGMAEPIPFSKPSSLLHHVRIGYLRG
uniref:Uncharacterized protein n=1 Tax=Micrurus corallinus TaxID=54390 RepID=A0A2D4ER42_MICCO